MSTAPSGLDYALKDLFDKRNICIPDYQRTYSWDKKTVEQLLDSLSEHQKQYPGNLQKNPYFLGNLMIHSDANDPEASWWLVDGQQRLVTLTIIAGVIRDLLCEVGDYKSAFDLQKMIIGKNDAVERFLKPRETKKSSSPRQLLWPIQAPMKQEIRFNFVNSYSASTSKAQQLDITQTSVKFPLSLDDKFVISPGVELIIKGPLEPGDVITDIYGELIIDAGVNIDPDDNLVMESRWREDVIKKMTTSKWNQNYKIPKHFTKHIPDYLNKEMEVPGVDKKKLLNDWKDILTYMHFTTTTFTEEDDAIYYFGKMNDGETRDQLNAGDLMRFYTHQIVAAPPLKDKNDDDILSQWDEIEATLKEDRYDADRLALFMHAWVIANANRCTEKQVYSEIKRSLKSEYRASSGSWDKNNFHLWIKKLNEHSKMFREICFWTAGDNYRHSMKCFWKLGKQHRPLLLAGLIALDDKSMERLIKIWEYMIVKGTEVSQIITDRSITSQEKYTLVDKYCKKLFKKSKKFTIKIPPQDAKIILGEMQDEVYQLCETIWTQAAADPNLTHITGWDQNTLENIETTQNQSLLLLSRIEIQNSGTSKTWKDDIEVEHIAPKTWKDDWSDISKGGGFKDEDEKNTYLDYLGNRTLLDQKFNGSLQNKSFHEKQKDPKSGFDLMAKDWQITKDLISSNVTTWGPNEIKARNKKFAGEIVKIYTKKFMN